MNVLARDVLMHEKRTARDSFAIFHKTGEIREIIKGAARDDGGERQEDKTKKRSGDIRSEKQEEQEEAEEKRQ